MFGIVRCFNGFCQRVRRYTLLAITMLEQLPLYFT
jgi:hypothetical protein